MFRGTLRNKFLLALVLIISLLTAGTLLVVRHRVGVHVREEIAAGLQGSIASFQTMQHQRESMLERSASLLAALPPLKAVLTSRDAATIQDASQMFWQLAGSQLFVMGDTVGNLLALHTRQPGLTRSEAQQLLTRMVKQGGSSAWWFGDGHLYQVFLQPVYFGAAQDNSPLGVLAVGYEIDAQVAADVGRVASAQVLFACDGKVVASTVQPGANAAGDRFLTKSAVVAPADASGRGEVTLTVLKSYEEATAFLRTLDHWVLGIGIVALLAGSGLVYFVSTTFTRPLAHLAGGVRALESGDFAYPLREVRGDDEVSVVTRAFSQMRVSVLQAQDKLVQSERLATIGQMASTISHDLRHPLTAILAYAEFLAFGNLRDEQRNDFYQEIRIAVNRMTDEINSLLGFSRHRESIRPRLASPAEVVDRAVSSVHVLPEFERISINAVHEDTAEACFDPVKLERVLLNLLYNACEAVSPDAGVVEVATRRTADGGLEIRVTDNGPGLPDVVRAKLFQPFVSYGKEHGTGLGLTVVHKIVQDHGGEVTVERTGPDGTVFRLVLPPRSVPAANPAAR